MLHRIERPRPRKINFKHTVNGASYWGTRLDNTYCLQSYTLGIPSSVNYCSQDNFIMIA